MSFSIDNKTFLTENFSMIPAEYYKKVISSSCKNQNVQYVKQHEEKPIFSMNIQHNPRAKCLDTNLKFDKIPTRRRTFCEKKGSLRRLLHNISVVPSATSAK